MGLTIRMASAMPVTTLVVVLGGVMCRSYRFVFFDDLWEQNHEAIRKLQVSRKSRRGGEGEEEGKQEQQEEEEDGRGKGS